MRGVELRDVATAAGRALTQILLVGVARLRLTYACQHAAQHNQASLVDDLGGSPKCIRACRLDLRGSYRVFTSCKELGTAAAAREAYVEYMILHHTPI